MKINTTSIEKVFHFWKAISHG